MRKVLFVLLIASLGLGIVIPGATADESILDPSSAKKYLENLNLLVNLSRAGIDTTHAATVDPRDYQEETMTGDITDALETDHAVILAYDNTEIPDFLAYNFDRIFTMVETYLNLKEVDVRPVIWVMGFDALQQVPYGAGTCFDGCAMAAALYAPVFEYILFTPDYMNDYYITHEGLHLFIDEYGKQVKAGLPEIIRRKYQGDVLGYNFLKYKEEEIVVDLSKIIIQDSLTTTSK